MDNKKLIKLLEEEIKEAKNYYQPIYSYNSNRRIKNKDRIHEIVNDWDICGEDDNNIWENGYIAGIYMAINMLKEVKNDKTI